MNKYHTETIKQALDSDELLSEWEVDFISNLADKDDNYKLSEKQVECLNKITSKIALGG